MAFCSNCGSQLRDGAAFCPGCGAQQAPSAQPAQPAQQTYQAQQPYQAQPVVQQNYQQANYGYNANQQQTYQQAYQSTGYAAAGAPPTDNRLIDADRSLIVVILLTIVTCGIYGYWFTYKLAQDMNTVCNDGDNTPGLAVYILLSIVTCGIYVYWWHYKIGNRQQANAPAYGFTIQENGTTILLWDILGAFLCGIGPFVALHIIIKNMNMLAAAYNNRILQSR